MRIAHRRFPHARRHGLFRRRRGRAHHGRQSAHEVLIGAVAGDREQIVELARDSGTRPWRLASPPPCGCDAPAAASRGADSSRPRARPPAPRRRRSSDRGSGMRPRARRRGNRADAGGDRCCCCRARGRSARADTSPPRWRSARRETRGSPRRGRAPAFCSPSAAAVECDLPIDRLEHAVDAHHRLGRALGRIHALEPEAVAVGDPGLVDLLVLPRHHAHHPAAQHVARRCWCRSRRAATPARFASSPTRARDNGTACC